MTLEITYESQIAGCERESEGRLVYEYVFIVNRSVFKSERYLTQEALPILLSFLLLVIWGVVFAITYVREFKSRRIFTYICAV